MKASSIYSLTALCAASALAVLGASGAHAQVSLSPTSVTATIMQGSTLTFTTSVTNTLGTTLTLGGDNINFLTQAGPTELFGPPTSPLSLAIDDTAFYSSLPITLAAGGTQSLTFYSLVAGSLATPGSYTGYFTLQNSSGMDLVGGTQNFSFTVSPLGAAPEPSGWVALAVGGSLLGLAAARRRKTPA